MKTIKNYSITSQSNKHTLHIATHNVFLRSDIINILIKKFNYSSYLEIGTFNKQLNFNLIQCKSKICVDPNPSTQPTFAMTSDDFFIQNTQTFDIVFIDGLHLHEQVFKDITNSLKVLNKNGTIVCHDMLPGKEIMQVRDPQTLYFGWTGDCWRAFFKCKSLFNNLDMCVVNVDNGVGVIREGKQELISVPENLDWQYFCNNKDLMNVISIEQFKNKFK
jgi:hypothetical protein